MHGKGNRTPDSGQMVSLLKKCHCCGCIKKELKLSDRIYRCGCGYVEDRDFNAALNLRDARTYKTA